VKGGVGRKPFYNDAIAMAKRRLRNGGPSQKGREGLREKGPPKRNKRKKEENGLKSFANILGPPSPKRGKRCLLILQGETLILKC